MFRPKMLATRYLKGASFVNTYMSPGLYCPLLPIATMGFCSAFLGHVNVTEGRRVVIALNIGIAPTLLSLDR